ncbi:hypothetical protein MJO28_004758 [Puccinia striiformis f. sp. tritici]|nr:hypothetical protein MJO28_004758 [Puccinia striiformis f. sp. tritici]KAI7959788.1 hypothetical protein MJO29_004856 [Puccinia striiformis f. sp. tritici]
MSTFLRRTGLRWPKFFTTSGSSRSTGNHNSLNPIGLAVTANQESDRSSSEEPLLSLELGPLSPAVSILSDQTNPQHPADSHGIPTTPGSPNPETPRKKIGLFVVAWSGLRLPTLIRATVWATAMALMHYLGIKAIDIQDGRVILSPMHIATSAALCLCGSTLGCIVMDFQLDLSGQLLCATLLSLSVFAFHYSGVMGMQIIASSRSLYEQRHRSGILPMDIAIIISVLAVATCLVSIGLLVYTASLSRNRMSELVNTKRKLGQLSIENETVARLAELKQNFISVASHELRTPLFSVTGYAELLARTDLNKEQRWYLSNMQQACSNMQLIIANVLDFSKLERNNNESCAKPVRVNIRSMLEGIAQMTEDRSDLAGRKRAVDLIVQVADNVPETTMLDETFFMRICMNLLSNALKFTERGLIMIDVEIDDSETLIFKVQDTGIGIPPNFMSSLFEPYRQADSSTTRPHQGTGLGLSICKQLVERLNGNIEVDSEVGKGTTFTVRLPLTGSSDPPQTVTQVQKHTICLAYNEQVTENRLSEALCNAGHRAVGIHSDLGAAQSLFSSGEVDLVFTDAISLQSSELLQTRVDRRRFGTGGVAPEETEDRRWPKYVLTSSTDLEEKFTQQWLMNAPNVIRIRRQGIIPHLIFNLLLDPEKYAHEVDLNVAQEQTIPERGREDSYRTVNSDSISSLGSSVFEFELPVTSQITESPASSPSGSNADQHETIAISLPSSLEDEKSPESREKGMETRTEFHRKILLVDDNPINVQLGARLLGVLGYQVDSAANGYEAVNKACASGYDLILMDCQMPGLDGLSATRQIREYEAHFTSPEGSRPVPIIALTANVSESDQADCRLSGMDGFLPKPLQINVLKSTLHTFLG